MCTRADRCTHVPTNIRIVHTCTHTSTHARTRTYDLISLCSLTRCFLYSNLSPYEQELVGQCYRHVAKRKKSKKRSRERKDNGRRDKSDVFGDLIVCDFGILFSVSFTDKRYGTPVCGRLRFLCPITCQHTCSVSATKCNYFRQTIVIMITALQVHILVMLYIYWCAIFFIQRKSTSCARTFQEKVLYGDNTRFVLCCPCCYWFLPFYVPCGVLLFLELAYRHDNLHFSWLLLQLWHCLAQHVVLPLVLAIASLHWQHLILSWEELQEKCTLFPVVNYTSVLVLFFYVLMFIVSLLLSRFFDVFIHGW